MEKQEEKTRVETSDCEEFIQEMEGINWPEEFPVCKRHKGECFADMEEAKLSAEELCVLCHPRESDSWGG